MNKPIKAWALYKLPTDRGTWKDNSCDIGIWLTRAKLDRYRKGLTLPTKIKRVTIKAP